VLGLEMLREMEEKMTKIKIKIKGFPKQEENLCI
jgi:hypothetical protein